MNKRVQSGRRKRHIPTQTHPATHVHTGKDFGVSSLEAERHSGSLSHYHENVFVFLLVRESLPQFLELEVLSSSSSSGSAPWSRPANHKPPSPSPTLIRCPGCRLKLKSLGASKSRTMVEPRLNSPTAAPLCKTTPPVSTETRPRPPSGTWLPMAT